MGFRAMADQNLMPTLAQFSMQDLGHEQPASRREAREGAAGRVVRRPLPGRRRMRRARGYLRDDHRAGPKVLRGVRRLRRVRARVRLMGSQRLRSVRRAALRMLRCSKMRAIQHVCGEQVCVGGPNVQAPLAWVTVNENWIETEDSCV